MASGAIAVMTAARTQKSSHSLGASGSNERGDRPRSERRTKHDIKNAWNGVRSSMADSSSSGKRRVGMNTLAALGRVSEREDRNQGSHGGLFRPSRTSRKEGLRDLGSSYGLGPRDRGRGCGLATIHPEKASWYNWWEIAVLSALLYTCFITPFEVAFFDQKNVFRPDHEQECSLSGAPDVRNGERTCLPLFLVVTNVMVDLCFIGDTILQFFIMIPVKSRAGVMWVDDARAIAHNYIRGWFLIDLVAILPVFIDWIGMGMSASDSGTNLSHIRVLKVVRTLRLLKLVRVLRGSRTLKRWTSEMGYSKQKLALCKWIAVVFFAAHVLACIWGLTTTFQDFTGSWSWHDDVLQEDGYYVTDMYIACLYWSFMTLTSIGYGDISPQNTGERVVATVCMLFSAVIWAMIIGGVTSVRTSLDAPKLAFRQRLDELNDIMQEKRLPIGLQRRMRQYFHERHDQHRHASYRSILTKLSPQLQRDLCVFVNEELLKRVRFLGVVSQQCFVDIALKFHVAVYAKGEHFGDVWTLYILEQGLVIRGSRVQGDGTVWGEDLILDDITLCEPAESMALTYVEVMMMPKDTLISVFQSYPEDRQALRKYAVRFVVRRGILREAAKRARAAPGASRKTHPALHRVNRNYIGDLMDMKKLSTRQLLWPEYAHAKRYEGVFPGDDDLIHMQAPDPGHIMNSLVKLQNMLQPLKQHLMERRDAMDQQTETRGGSGGKGSNLLLPPPPVQRRSPSPKSPPSRISAVDREKKRVSI